MLGRVRTLREVPFATRGGVFGHLTRLTSSHYLDRRRRRGCSRDLGTTSSCCNILVDCCVGNVSRNITGNRTGNFTGNRTENDCRGDLSVTGGVLLGNVSSSSVVRLANLARRRLRRLGSWGCRVRILPVDRTVSTVLWMLSLYLMDVVITT